MAKKINVDAVSVTVIVAHQGPGGPVKVGAQYTTDQSHAVALETAGYVTIDGNDVAPVDAPIENF